MPCISFIVPIYNMERLLPRALRSLRAQTLTDFEAILINDGSKDTTLPPCRKKPTPSMASRQSIHYPSPRNSTRQSSSPIQEHQAAISRMMYLPPSRLSLLAATLL